MNEDYAPDNLGEYTVQGRRKSDTMMLCVHSPPLESIDAMVGDTVEFVERDGSVVMRVKKNE